MISDINVKLNVSQLPEIRRCDLYAKKEILEESLDTYKKILEKTDKKYKYRYQGCVKRLTNKLVTENRIKSRKLGAGPRSLIDTEDEEFIARAIESKSSAHGRRHDTVLYLNHRVKSEDLLSIANYHLMQRGKKLIKSSRTVGLYARPRRLNTREGRRHKGHWLFCSKKPPKTEDHETILTHHQRASVKLNRIDMFGLESPLIPWSLDISFDDKAYIRPGTDVGFKDTRAGKILQVSDTSKQRKLPQHDFGTSEVYQTPSSFRLMTWREKDINGERKILKDHDQSYVVVRPKFYVGSSGCVWASDMIRLRYENPDAFEVISDGNRFSAVDRKVCAMIHDGVFYFIDSTTALDIQALDQGEDFVTYEKKRIGHLIQVLQDVSNDLKDISTECQVLGTLYQEILRLAEELMSSLSEGKIEAYKTDISNLTEHCKNIIDILDSLKLPPVKTIIAEYTDAGPGVGISNTAVRFRFAEMCRIQNTERRVRLHRASGDSAQNEAERTNSAIGDALVDGASLRWEYFKPLDGLTAEEILNLSSTDTEKLKKEAMEKNAWRVALEVCQRIDAAPGPAGDFIKAYVTERPENHFFWNGSYMKKFVESSKSTKSLVPGHGYFQKILDFIEIHFEVGELHLEYRRNSCLNEEGEKCGFCSSASDVGFFHDSAVKMIPRPFPGKDFHYLPYKETPLLVNGIPRSMDDY